MRIEKEIAAECTKAAQKHADRRVQISLETAVELCIVQFGVKGTVERLAHMIDYLNEFED